MESENRDGWVSIVVILFTLASALGGGFSLRNMLPDMQHWQAPIYAIVGGIFIAIADVILIQVLSSFRSE